MSKLTNISEHCNKTLKSEVLNLKQCASSLREMLEDCRSAVHDETRLIHENFLNEIEAIYNAKDSVEKELFKTEEVNKQLLTEIKFAKDKTTEMQTKISNLQNELVNSKTIISNFEIKFESLQKRYENLVNNEVTHKADKKNLQEEIFVKQTKIESLENEIQKLKDNLVIGEMKFENLEIESQENKACEISLQEHVTELEAICESLRGQLNAQHNYFVQKEIASKANLKKLNNNYKQECNKLKFEISTHREKHVEARKLLETKTLAVDKLRKRMSMIESKNNEQKLSLDVLKNQLEVEKETVKLLKKKNEDLNKQNIISHQQVHNKNSLHSNSNNSDQYDDLKTTLQRYFEKNLKQIETTYQSELENKCAKIVELEKLLHREQQHRNSLEITLNRTLH